MNAAKHFFRKAMKRVGSPRVITLDAYAASHRAVRELKSEGPLPQRVRVRSSKFKRFDSATLTISGIELVHKIKKPQFKTRTLGGSSATMPELWNAVWPPDPQS